MLKPMTQTEFDFCAERKFTTAQEIHQASIDYVISRGREDGLSNEEIAAILDNRFGIYVDLDEENSHDNH